MALWVAMPPETLAQSLFFPSEGLLDQVQAYYTYVANEINGSLTGWAEIIFGVAATIQAALLLWEIMIEEMARRRISGGGVRGVLQKLLFYFFFVGIGAYMLSNNQFLTDEFEIILYNEVAPHVLDESCFQEDPSNPGEYDPISASQIVELGWWVFFQSKENAWLAIQSGQVTDSTSTGSGGTSSTDSFWSFSDEIQEEIDSFTASLDYITTLLDPLHLTVFFAMLLIIPTYYVIAFQVVIAELTLTFLGGLLPFFLAFLPLTFLSPIVSGYIRYYLYTVFKLFFIYILLVPILKLPGIIIALSSTDTAATEPSPINDCTNSALDSPQIGGSTFDAGGDFDAANIYSRMDMAITITAFALASAALLKTIPSRLAGYVTRSFSLRPLYDLVD